MIRAYISPVGERAAAYRLLARAVEDAFGISCPEIEKDTRGKPYFPARPDIHFSVSHTDHFVMAAVGTSPCGCDVQSHRQLHSGVAERVCAPEELERLPFFDLWALKESYIKLRGFLPAPLSELRFIKTEGALLMPEPDVLARLYSLSGASAAVCAREEPPAALIIVDAYSL